MLHFKNSIDRMDKAPKIWKRSKIVYSPQCRRKTRLKYGYKKTLILPLKKLE
ncbi:hypothetical protein [Wolbachia endosymbiont of Litomosoides brasiliensis]|uniref:hypothetical protein n=1 Tax=Wolbachia endosymbiont of Litomosoides brasiliensis TaxID=1812117 RepID=UPI00397D143D